MKEPTLHPWTNELKWSIEYWGTRLKEDWKELGVKSVGGWCNKVKDKGWLASKLGTKKKKGRAKKKIDSSAS